MDIAEQLLKNSDSLDLASLAGRFGLSEAQAGSAVSALLPAILGGVQKTEQAGALGQFGALAQALGAPADDISGGNAILGQIFGSKDVSREVASQAASKTGISDTVLKAMLPVIAGLVAQQFAKGTSGSQGGGLLGGLAGSVLGSVLGGGKSASAGGLGSLGGLASMLDRNGDGNPLDDILGMVAGRK